jgi:hypothetical protein
MGYAAIYPEDVIAHHRAFIARRRAERPSEEYRELAAAEWDQFLADLRRAGRHGRWWPGTSSGCGPVTMVRGVKFSRVDRDQSQPRRRNRKPSRSPTAAITARTEG